VRRRKRVAPHSGPASTPWPTGCRTVEGGQKGPGDPVRARRKGRSVPANLDDRAGAGSRCCRPARGLGHQPHGRPGVITAEQCENVWGPAGAIGWRGAVDRPRRNDRHHLLPGDLGPHPDSNAELRRGHAVRLATGLGGSTVRHLEVARAFQRDPAEKGRGLRSGPHHPVSLRESMRTTIRQWGHELLTAGVRGKPSAATFLGLPPRKSPGGTTAHARSYQSAFQRLHADLDQAPGCRPRSCAPEAEGRERPAAIRHGHGSRGVGPVPRRVAHGSVQQEVGWRPHGQTGSRTCPGGTNGGS